jgi:CDP-glycerol glycerophosphotransferase
VPGRPLISVIIPVHDVADYLPECLDSVLGPPLADVEVIAIDDASSDGGDKLLEERAASDSRLRVIHLESNAGPGHARNVGLQTAAGEYVWFVDGDDRLAGGALTAIQARLAELAGGGHGPDVLLIDWVSSYPDGRTEPSPGRDLLGRVPPAGCTLEELPRLIDLTMTSWSKLLRREFLARLDVPFASGIHEDVIVTCAALLEAESVAALNQVCYRYRRGRPGSCMATTGTGHLAIFASYERVFALIAARRAAGAEVSDAVQAAVFERAIWHYATVLHTGLSRAGLVPRGDRRRFFARMHADFVACRPPGYRPPAGARGLKFALIERGAYRTYSLLKPLNEARVAAVRLAGRNVRRT